MTSSRAPSMARVSAERPANRKRLYVPAFEVLKLIILLGRAVGEEEVFKEVFSAYLQRFRSPVKLMPNWRTIHQTARGTRSVSMWAYGTAWGTVHTFTASSSSARRR